jgi:hypothetical protein
MPNASSYELAGCAAPQNDERKLTDAPLDQVGIVLARFGRRWRDISGHLLALGLDFVA